MANEYVIFDGYNADPNNGDEVNGAGINEPLWPVLFDTFVALAPLIVNGEMLAAFDGCADITIPHVQDTFVIPHQIDTIVVMGVR